MIDDKGESPLDLALNAEVAYFLISRGCGSSNKDKDKALCGACKQDVLKIVKELVERHKVDPNREYIFMTLLVVWNLAS